MDPEELMQMQRDMGRIEGRMEGIQAATMDNAKEIGALRASLGSLQGRLSWLMGVYSVAAGIVGVGASVIARKIGLA